MHLLNIKRRICLAYCVTYGLINPCESERSYAHTEHYCSVMLNESEIYTPLAVDIKYPIIIIYYGK